MENILAEFGTEGKLKAHVYINPEIIVNNQLVVLEPFFKEDFRKAVERDCSEYVIKGDIFINKTNEKLTEIIDGKKEEVEVLLIWSYCDKK